MNVVHDKHTQVSCDRLPGTAGPGSAQRRKPVLSTSAASFHAAAVGAARACVPRAAFTLVAALLLALASAPGLALAHSLSKGFGDLAERLSPAVVNISTTQVIEQGAQPEFRVPPGSPFEDFFKEFFERNQQPRAPRRATSLGSGFIIDADGLVVTNNHVIAEADEITVRFSDGSTLEAEVIGRDPKTDLALLRVEPETPLPALQWGNSDTARVGDWVLAIGNPFGLGGTVTAGIVSARGRDINAGPYDDFIQTDASINRGNSGGPLFNLAGEVIGINTAIFSPTGGSIGIGFAIPSTLARNVIRQLSEFGRTRRGWLGVRIQTVTDEIAEGLGLDEATGALVAGVTEGGPAAAAGLAQGDVILRFDNREVTAMRALPRIVAETEIGKDIDVEIWRKGERKLVRIKIGELEEDAEAKVAAVQPQAEPVREAETLGMKLSAITPEVRERFELDEAVTGVAVTDVDAEGAAADKGIRPGDVIVEVQQDEVSKPDEVLAKVEEMRTAERRAVLLLLRQRSGDLRFVAVTLDDG